jgi:hypothetical protein
MKLLCCLCVFLPFQFLNQWTDFRKFVTKFMPRNFQYTTVSSNNIAYARTYEVEVTLVPLNLE